MGIKNSAFSSRTRATGNLAERRAWGWERGQPEAAPAKRALVNRFQAFSCIRLMAVLSPLRMPLE